MYKRAWCTCKAVVLLIKPIAFLPSSLPSPWSLLKLSTVAVQRNATNRGRIIVEWCLHWSSGYRSDCHSEGDAFRTRYIRVEVKKPIVESSESSVVGPAFYFYFACRLCNYLQNLLKKPKDVLIFTRVERSTLLIFLLIEFRVSIILNCLGNFDQVRGPIYFIVFLPNRTVSNLGSSKPLFHKLYWRRSQKYSWVRDCAYNFKYQRGNVL